VVTVSARSTPNVVLLTVDALRADLFVDDEGPSVPTPNIDGLSDEALRATNGYANAPHTRAAFPAILTGTYPWAHGGYETLGSERPSLAERMADGGYATGGFHSNPYLEAEFGYDRGFDRFVSNSESVSRLAAVRRRLTKVFSGDRKDTFLYRAIEQAHALSSRVTGVDIGVPYLSGEALNETVASWLEDTTEPLFLWAHYMDPHDPYLPRPDTVSQDIPRRRSIRLQKRLTSDPDAIDGDERADLMRLYRGEVEYLDRCIGELLEVIRTELEPTLVVLTADHGEAFDEHGYYRHPDAFHEELIKIPLLLTGPQVTPGRIDGHVSAVDVMPTVLGLCDLDIPDGCHGSPVTSDEGRRRQVFAETGEPGEGRVMTVRDGWKLVADADGSRPVLYDLRADPDERDDVAAERVDVVADLRSDILEHVEEVTSKSDTGEEPSDVSDDVRDRLARLGYTRPR